MDKKNDLLNGITHLTQTTIKFEGEQVIYIDPFEVPGTPHDADFVFITHDHMDHFSILDIKKVIKDNTKLIIPKKLKKEGKKLNLEITMVKPNNKYNLNNLTFETTPAYNIDKKFHPKRKGWVGYILEFNDNKYYYAGDTDFIPEMADIKTDVAFLPVGGTYMMTSAEAVEAANTLKPKVVVPYHFGKLVGSRKDAEFLVSKLDSEISGTILK